MKSKLNEEKRQLLRKENEKSSRLLDNYYNPNIHKKIWEPSGSIKSKTNYLYGDSGFSNIKDSSLSKEKNIEQIHFLEFDFLEENDIIVIIEYYSNNSKNLNQTNYFKDVYKILAKLLQLCITTRFPFIKTILKPTDMNIKMSRAGAFEIQLGMKLNGNTQIINLFSKLKSGQWPNFKNILHKINSHMPILSFKFQVYDKDEGENSQISSGTWSLLGIKSEKPLTDKKSEAANWTNEGGVGYIRYLKNIMGMWLINGLKKELCPDKPFAEIIAESKESRFEETVDANSAEFLSPVSMKDAFDNALTEKPVTIGDYFRCAYRSLALSYKSAIEELEDNTGKKYDKIYIVGGGAKNGFLNKLTEEITGKEVVALPIEATAIGNLKIQIKTLSKGL